MKRLIASIFIAAGLIGFAVVMPFAAKPAPDDAIPLVTGRVISPVGMQLDVGSFPANLLLSPDGRFVLATNTGFRQYLTAIDAAAGTIVSKLEVGHGDGSKEGLYYGLAFDPRQLAAPFTLYAARGAEEQIAVYSLDASGKLTDTGRRFKSPTGIKRSPNNMAGIALSADGKRLFAANNCTSAFTRYRGELTVFDTTTGSVIGKVELPGFPLAVAAGPTGPYQNRVYVTSERDGVVSVIDTGSLKVIANVATGDHPTGMAFHRSKPWLYVANSGSDTISVIDLTNNKVRGTIPLRPPSVRGLAGATPLGVTISQDQRYLFVPLADMNAVAVASTDGTLLGYMPAGWYPTSVAVTNDGRRLFVANAKGARIRNPNGRPVGNNGQYIQNIIDGSVTVTDVADPGSLGQQTSQVLLNNRINEARRLPRFQRPPIEHVFYIIKENRTYDQMLGDMTQGNGDPSLCLFPRSVTPNQHALAERFALMDNFYCAAEVSYDGWAWSTQGMGNEYVERNTPYNYSGRGRTYDSEGDNNDSPVDLLDIPDVARGPGGYIWEAVAKKGLSYRNYGFFLSFVGPADRGPEGKPLAINNTPNKKLLVGHTDEDFLQFDMTYADSDAWWMTDTACPKQQKSYGKKGSRSRVEEWKREFDEFVKNGNLPRFTMMRLPRDHTSGTTEGLHSPRAMVADNDYAVGQIVEAISHSPYWKKSAIFILEDDAQNGHDHVDAHRSIAFVISPFVRKNTVDHRFYNTDSMLRTMGLILGTPPLCQYDALAAPFQFLSRKPENDASYSAILPERVVLGEVNKKTAYGAQESARLDFKKPDAVPDAALNRIVWHSVRGSNSPEPPIRRGLFAGRKESAQ